MENEEDKQKNHESPERQSQGGQLKKIGLIGVIVSDLVGYTAAGFGIGYLAWSKWHAPWWVLMLTSLGGLSLAFYQIYQLSKREME